MERHPTVAHCFDRGLGQRLHVDEPLVAQPRLDDRVAAVAVSHRVHVVVGLDEQAGGVEVGDDPLARLVALEAGVGPALCRDRRVSVHDVDLGAVVALADLEVVRVVGGRHLHRARPEGRVDVIVGHDRDLAAEQR